MAGADALVRPNLKLTLNARTESATGAPPGGWAASGSLVAPETTTSKVSAELEVVTIGLVFAF
jgi:hypothetical protein